MDSLAERFESRYTPEPTTGCWLWESTCNPHGYGRLVIEGKQVSAHRVSYTLHVGGIPEGLSVLHRCDTPSCVNPAHLFVGTQGDNVRDSASKGRHYVGKQTACKRGHEFDQWNTLYRHNGRQVTRVCRECRNDRNRRYKKANR